MHSQKTPHLPLWLRVKQHNHPARQGSASLRLVCVVAPKTTQARVLTQRAWRTPKTRFLRPLRLRWKLGWHRRRTAGILLKSHFDFHWLLMLPGLLGARAITFPSFPIDGPIQHLLPSPRAWFRQERYAADGNVLVTALPECKSTTNQVFLDGLDVDRGERKERGGGGWGRWWREQRDVEQIRFHTFLFAFDLLALPLQV